MKPLGQTIVLTMLLAGAAGCATDDSFFLTERLWRSEVFRHFHEPAADPRLEVYRSEKPPDYLVTYDEVRETDGRIRRRAFYLKANANRVVSGHRPGFVNPAKASNLEVLPAVAIVAKGDHWQIQEGGSTIVDFSLPTYPARGATTFKVLLTPLTVAGDAVIVGSILGIFVASVYAHGGGHCYSAR